MSSIVNLFKDTNVNIIFQINNLVKLGISEILKIQGVRLFWDKRVNIIYMDSVWFKKEYCSTVLTCYLGVN